MQDPIIESIRKAENRLTNSTSFLRFLGQQAMNEKHDESEEEIGDPGGYHFISLVLNLVNTYLYMVNAPVLDEETGPRFEVFPLKMLTENVIMKA